MNVDIEKLEALAKAATPGRVHDRLDSCGGGLKYECFGDDGSLVLKVDHKNDEWGFVGERGEQDEAFFLACTPAAVLKLVADIKTLGSYLCTCPSCGGEGEIFSGGYSYFGHIDPPEPNMDKCVECDGKGLIGTPQDLHTVIAERDQLKAENEALRKDAERYRWFRDNSLQIVHASQHCFVHRLDKAIDEAMSREAACTHSVN